MAKISNNILLPINIIYMKTNIAITRVNQYILDFRHIRCNKIANNRNKTI